MAWNRDTARHLVWFLILAPSLLSVASRSASAAGPTAKKTHFEPQQLLVRFRPGTSAALKENVHRTNDVERVLKRYRIVDGLELVKLSHPNVEAAVRALGRNPNVLYAEPDYVVEPTVVPNDPDFGLLWGLLNTGQEIAGVAGTPGADARVSEAWNLWTGDPNFKIAVIDTGIFYNHVDLSANLWTNPGEIPGNNIDDDGNGWIDDIHGYDFVHNDGDPLDKASHGSHVAGTIGAVANNGIGVAGINWRCKIVSLKFIENTGRTSDAVSAFEYVLASDIKVSNNSWGGGGYSQALRDAIEATQSIGHIAVMAAGNSAENGDAIRHYPSSFDLPNIIAVAALDNQDKLASFSNWGASSVDLGAPGVAIYSTVNGQDEYAFFCGTSMASPHVTGVVALAMSRRPQSPWQEIRDRILQTVRPVTATGWTLRAGTGVVDTMSPIVSGLPLSSELTGFSTSYALKPEANVVILKYIWRFSAAGRCGSL